jgi:hypothetical protein
MQILIVVVIGVTVDILLAVTTKSERDLPENGTLFFPSWFRFRGGSGTFLLTPN